MKSIRSITSIPAHHVEPLSRGEAAGLQLRMNKQIIQALGSDFRGLQALEDDGRPDMKLWRDFLDYILFQIPERYAKGVNLRFSFPVTPRAGTEDTPTSIEELSNQLIADYKWFHPDNPYLHQKGELFEINDEEELFPITLGGEKIGYVQAPRKVYTALQSIFSLASREVIGVFRAIQQYQRESRIRKKTHLYYNLAYRDSLTHLPNRRALEEKWRNMENSLQEQFILLVDVDDFKAVNDTYGHAKGDEVLQFIAACMRQFFRKEHNEHNFVGRLGGEEFLIFLLENSADDAKVIADNFREFIGKQESPVKGVQVRVSIGMNNSAGYSHDSAGFSDVLQHADLALYMAKGMGKNRVEVYSVDEYPDVSGHKCMASELERRNISRGGDKNIIPERIFAFLKGKRS